MREIKKAIFPVAGFGSRFLPATKSIPKEMLPIVDKPLIQYAVEEAVEAGITEIIFITGRNKRAIEDHFDKAFELETDLERRGKDDLLNRIQKSFPQNVSYIYIRQIETLGLGHAILCAKPVIGDNPFAVILADDLIDSNPGAISQMVVNYNQFGVSMVAVQDVPREDTGSYGIVEIENTDQGQSKITNIVEKPDPTNAPSTLGVVGRYLLDPTIFDYLENLGFGAGGEIQLTDAIANLLKRKQVNAFQFEGKRYDCGSKIGFLEASVAYGLKRKDLSEEFLSYLQSTIAKIR
ncbi:MAG: UTP--glucose-1-phosphate uridylyltransferase [Proteobacteria bacterium]|mgnify:CR=1 FL=1|nr:UTP--glucose-1-phosphate uridylyltransferase [Pseudomonadota bacterium]